eukprot:CAMPEP_0115094720 /NCGR_PEP_ID=MMETSP0227-20121206/28546_1 /TAXON_ID=89957 /ORGANISM="Polarella glacialis, Strain CCMP 1383" /LENGTH=36 /DNA_ID= /DNA_START= /DNA_END= /DNA_ORIENTATION=
MSFWQQSKASRRTSRKEASVDPINSMTRSFTCSWAT